MNDSSMPDLTGCVRESRIEAIVEWHTDLLDKAYVGRGTMTTAEYETATRKLNKWAERQYARIGA
jgi:hypothetical protein